MVRSSSFRAGSSQVDLIPTVFKDGTCKSIHTLFTTYKTKILIKKYPVTDQKHAWVQIFEASNLLHCDVFSISRDVADGVLSEAVDIV